MHKDKKIVILTTTKKTPGIQFTFSLCNPIVTEISRDFFKIGFANKRSLKTLLAMFSYNAFKLKIGFILPHPEKKKKIEVLTSDPAVNSGFFQGLQGCFYLIYLNKKVFV